MARAIAARPKTTAEKELENVESGGPTREQPDEVPSLSAQEGLAQFFGCCRDDPTFLPMMREIYKHRAGSYDENP